MSAADEGHLMGGDGLKGRWRGVATIATATWRVDRRLTIKTIGLDLAAGQAAPLLAIGIGLLVDGHRLAALLMLTASATAIVAAGRAALLCRIRLEERVSHAIAAEVVGIVTGIATVDHHENPKHLKRVERLLNYNWLIGMAVPALVLLTEALIRFIATIAVLSLIDARLAALPLAIVPVLIASAWAERLRLVSLDARAEFDRRAMDQFWLVSGRWSGRDPDAELRVFGLGEPLVDIHNSAWSKVVRDEVIHRTKGGVVQALTRAGFAAAFGLGLVLLARRATDGDVTPGELVTALGLAGQVLQQASTVAANGNWLNWALTSVRDYVWLLDHRDALAGPAGGQDTPPVRLDEGIRLEDVTFAYGQGDDAKTVLANIDLHLRPGEVVAIVGSNGAGKTTLTKLLLGLHRPTSGRITVDGVDVNGIDPAAWRARSTAALQEHMRPELQAGTAIGIGDLDRLEDTAAITRASTRAGADTVVDGLPSGGATQLGTDWPDGVELSGGEWQRIAVARSAMRTGDLGPLLLVLDEPAAALDPEAEHRLFELYTETADGRAERGAVTVLVSHRLSTVRDADRIVVLEHGRIVEVGGHNELMAAGGRYAHLFGLQASSYR